MKKSLNLIFWGYILALIRIDVGIDILPDPVGYGMIAIGCDNLFRSFPKARKPSVIAAALVFISFPTLVVDVNKVTTLGWTSYAMFLAIAKLILVYYLFLLFKEMLQDSTVLLKRIDSTFIAYMIVNFIVLLHMSFSVNLPDHRFQLIALIIILSALIMEISLLVLIRTIRREVPDEI